MNYARFATVITAALLCATAQATPLTLTQQGRVFGTSGTPIEGVHSIEVSLFADDDPASTALWSEAYSLTFVDGYYTVKLGEDALNPLDPADFAGDVFYSLSYDGNPDLPRAEFTSVPFSLRAAAADVADGLSASATVDYSAIVNAPTVETYDGTDFATSDQACTAGTVVTGVDANGDLTCAAAASSGAPAHTGAVYRWAVFGTYDQRNWMHGNQDDMFGGVNPSTWTDGNALASDMSTDMEVLRSLFTRKGYGGTNANVYSNVFTQWSSTNGQVVVALFRIRNTTASPITWTPVFNYTCFSGWSERASVALNGVEEWNSGTEDCVQPSVRSEGMSLPANQTSTVIFVSASSIAQRNDNYYSRSVSLAFRDNSLALPTGLEYVDDLDTATALLENN